MTQTAARRTLVAHVVYSFKAGGLENVIVQLINRLPAERFAHVVIALTEYSEDFVRRVERADARFISLHKPPGQIFRLYPRLWRLFRELRPDVLHTCNLAAMEVVPLALACGVPLRVHAEHGWVMADPDGSNKRYRLMRRVYRPFVSRFVAVSQQLRDYLCGPIGVPASQLSLVPNGVDVEAFRPRQSHDTPPADWPFAPGDWVVGTVGRLDPVKNQRLLIEACAQLVDRDDEARQRLRLVIVGEGGERLALAQRLAETGLSARSWMPGSRSDVPQILRNLGCFVLPSIAEGTSCTLQEAMASGLPIIATAVGGNGDVLAPASRPPCGVLVPSGEAEALSEALRRFLHDTDLAAGYANTARAEACEQHSLTRMLTRYEALFSRDAVAA